MDSVKRRARPKVNLYLHVTGQRDDRYHLLDSLVAFPVVESDIITVTKADNYSLDVIGPYAHLTGKPEDNLITRAAEYYFHQHKQVPLCSVTLEKNIPVGAGLGGGSGDAAETIRALEQLYGPMDNRNSALTYLGADVPVCYEARSCRFEGIGDIITPVMPLPLLHIVLAWPGVSSYTKDVFAAYHQNFGTSNTPLPPIPSLTTQDDLLQFLQTTTNDLAGPAEQTCPPITQAREAMKSQKGCALARMSGSGSTVFGLFKDENYAKSARDTIALEYPSWWVRSGTL